MKEFEAPTFENHYTYCTGDDASRRRSYVDKMIKYSTENKDQLRQDVVREARETYKDAEKTYSQFINLEGNMDKLSVEDLMKEIKKIDHHTVAYKVDKAIMEVQRVLGLFDDIYVVCHMTMALKIENDKLIDIEIKMKEAKALIWGLRGGRGNVEKDLQSKEEPVKGYILEPSSTS